MITPGKFIPYGQSVLSKLGWLLAELDKPMSIADLRRATKRHFADPSEFIYAMDTLYVLGVIDIDESRKVVRHAHED